MPAMVFGVTDSQMVTLLPYTRIIKGESVGTDSGSPNPLRATLSITGEFVKWVKQEPRPARQCLQGLSDGAGQALKGFQNLSVT